MFKNLINYFEQNREDLSVVVSKFILLIMKNYDSFHNKQLIYDLLDLARNCFNWKSFDNYNENGEDCRYLSHKDKHDVKEILFHEFIAN